MTPVASPSSNCYVDTRDFTKEKMHYSVVQVSKHRYVVAEYGGTTARPNGDLPMFGIVSEPMKYTAACQMALKLTNKRLNRSLWDISPADREKYPNVDDDTIIAHKIVCSLGDGELMNIRAELKTNLQYEEEFHRLHLRLPMNMGQDWIKKQVFAELVNRKIFSEDEL